MDELGKKVDTKLSSEMQKKIDKNDMKKNNHMINKKIDTLENKISKTLVDTLIDLQMEEAPLIVKKPFNPNTGNINEREKCASCNQMIYYNTNSVIMEEQHCHTHSYGNNNSYNSNNFNSNPNSTKFKFKNVQENCYKFGAGSYSRYLNSIDNAEDLRAVKSLQLPDIGYGGNKTTKKFNNLNLKIKHGDLIALVGPSGSGKTTTVLSLADQISDKIIIQLTYNSELKEEVVQKKLKYNETMYLDNLSIYE